MIENHAGRMVIGYNLELVDANGRLAASLGQILAPSVLPAGIPDGGSLYAMGNGHVDPAFQSAGRVQTMSPDRGQRDFRGWPVCGIR